MSHSPTNAPEPGAPDQNPGAATPADSGSVSTDSQAFDELETYLDYQPAAPTATLNSLHQAKVGPLVMVETAFLASTACLIWLVNTYFPPGPILRILFPLPMALVYLRWGGRAAWMSALVSGLLLAVLMGPPRSLLFLMPYAVMGVQLGFLWSRRANWYVAIGLGTIIGTLGFFFRVWLTSILLGEDLWVYLTSQVTQLLSWILDRLIDLGLLGLGVVGEPNLAAVQALAVVMVVLSNIVYLFTVHLAGWLLLERLGAAMPAPPEWVQTLLEE
ncbi:DUF2232 domain-containing protein [Pseudanabaena sp. FACHB-2040]|uniref:DUF2232 domain-containing protein n=1 Tax=Pseudanabaena sp. FACHB-2040 TaxID=2692859 RepID=UPI00168363D9|nr:DUF2232 domain-containing protein [Pseudanabaena sp. FACHB-2040]MBD2260126.1 DUF2232 domain-containing protein [Pseudanabaena sp. FACHB-2040]